MLGDLRILLVRLGVGWLALLRGNSKTGLLQADVQRIVNLVLDGVFGCVIFSWASQSVELPDW